ncbi:MAG: LysR family transcriptional regulator [Clostridiales bacterium]|nr:LysR family transcriptional regulator [Clostridiales bacterium]
MNPIQIEYFLTLVKHMNFTAAAKELFVSQPAISKQINALEKEVGAPLFFRTSRTVRLTPSGDIMHEKLSLIMDMYNSAVKEAHDAYAIQSGSIRLGILDQWNFNDLYKKSIVSIEEEFPNINLYTECHSFTGLINALENNNLDMIITILPEVIGKNNIRYEEIGETQAVLVMRKSNQFMAIAEPSLKDFENEDFFILSPEVAANARDFLVDLCAAHGFEPKKIHYFPNYESMRFALEIRRGVAIVDINSRLCSGPNLELVKLDYFHKIVVAWKNDNLNSFIPAYLNFLRRMQD